ncbi:MAG: putative transcriptional regulatory protein TcrX [Elusimicrobia bacterium]|nr:putative transcriptional regulatory protein TcrX [Elusimicrobiota bacterium]
MKILVVDDHYATARLLKRFFEREGHDVCVFPNASWCLPEFRKSRFDVAFIDIILGDDLTNGLELASELKRRDPDLRLNLMSAFWSYSDRVMCAGFGELVRKPFELEALHSKLINGKRDSVEK